VDKLFEAKEKQSHQARLKAESHEAALAAFPALREKDSEFSRRVQARLDERQQAFGSTPTEEFDVANQVAREMGVEVSRVVAPGFVGRPESASQPEPEEGPQGIDMDRAAEIARNLQYALPLRRNPETGKMERKKFNLANIKERSKEYEEHAAVYKGGRKIGGR
jgi:hypothetical protein